MVRAGLSRVLICGTYEGDCSAAEERACEFEESLRFGGTKKEGNG